MKNMQRAIFLEISKNLLPQKVLDTYCENQQWLQKILSDFKFKSTQTHAASPVVLLYGSAVSGTAFAQGDADFAVLFPNPVTEVSSSNHNPFHEIPYGDQVQILSSLFQHINERCSTNCPRSHRIFPARVPIIQYKKNESDRKFKFDLSLSLHGVENSLLIRKYMESEPQLRLGVLCVKHWGKKMKLINAKNGWISAYSLTILYIFFMIRTGRISEPIDESEVQKKVRSLFVDLIYFKRPLDEIPEFTTVLPLQECDVDAAVRDIFDFFHFYGDTSFFDFDVDVVDIRRNGTIGNKEEWLSKLEKLDPKERWHLLGYESIMVRDPYECHNLARSVEFFRGEAIREAFRTSFSKKDFLKFLHDVVD